MHRCPSIEKRLFGGELRGFGEAERLWGFLWNPFSEDVSSHLIISLIHLSGSVLRHSCSLFSSSPPRPQPPAATIPLVLLPGRRTKIQPGLLQECEQCCWAHVPKLRPFPHPPAAPLSWSSPGTLYYVSCPPPIPDWSASGQLFSAQLGLSADPFW